MRLSGFIVQHVQDICTDDVSFCCEPAAKCHMLFAANLDWYNLTKRTSKDIGLAANDGILDCAKGQVQDPTERLRLAFAQLACLTSGKQSANYTACSILLLLSAICKLVQGISHAGAMGGLSPRRQQAEAQLLLQ